MRLFSAFVRPSSDFVHSFMERNSLANRRARGQPDGGGEGRGRAAGHQVADHAAHPRQLLEPAQPRRPRRRHRPQRPPTVPAVEGSHQGMRRHAPSRSTPSRPSLPSPEDLYWMFLDVPGFYMTFPGFTEFDLLGWTEF